MLSINDAALWSQNATFYIRENALLFTAGILCSMPLFKVLKEAIGKRNEKAASLCEHLGVAVQLVLFIVSVSYLVMNAHNPFIYFNF